MKDPVIAIAIAAVMMLAVVKTTYPNVFWGVLITLLIYTLQRLLKQSGFSWMMWKK